jgi:hypothetical protein
MINNNQPNTGCFVEKDFGNHFTYRKTMDVWALEQGHTHEIDVAGDSIRFGSVKKTVAYILCDGVDGAALEKWQLKNNYVY